MHIKYNTFLLNNTIHKYQTRNQHIAHMYVFPYSNIKNTHIANVNLNQYQNLQSTENNTNNHY